ncbi:YwmB family TATA-box binding protein [Bacillus sp. HMF5848]|uniref:YwmB family TATA-box binding protein n=1 Tax=Bacillus sp. HMF5848 TaxID=2495421 RepID=UPI00163A7CF5|nr:YwmB family TATA-box binding protein [Bacillus sp. HMF5848]
MHTIYMGILSIILLASTLFSGELMEKSMQETELETIANIYERNNITITDWSLYTKAPQLESATFNEDLLRIQQAAEAFTWTVEKNHDVTKAVGVYVHPSTHSITETIQIVQENHSKKSYVFYEMKGSKWTSQIWRDFQTIFHNRKIDIFQENTTNFSCMKGIQSGNMKSVLKNNANRLLKEFQAQPVEMLDEETLLSISAYTEMWKQTIPTKNNKQMNLQLALRAQEGGDIVVVAGTPILTIEY